MIALLFTLMLSLLVTRIGTMALMLTGLSRESARFQARSAFTGVGFTTSESESIVGHPVRRRIVMQLMLVGNLGIATVVATLLISFLNTSKTDAWLWNIGLLAVGLFVLWLLASNQTIERHLNRLIAFGLRRWAQLDVKDYVALLQLQNGYAITELLVEPGDWIANKSLIDLSLTREGILVLGIQRHDGPYLGTPRGDATIGEGDTVVLYGPIDRLRELDQRRHGRQGDVAHVEAVEEHREDLAEQIEKDAETESKISD